MDAVLQGCQAVCAPCSEGNARVEEPLKLKVCSWAEEEVGLDADGPRVRLDYGFLGRLTVPASPSRSNSEQSSPPLSARSSGSSRRSPCSPTQRTATPSRPRLYDPGTLTPLYNLGSRGATFPSTFGGLRFSISDLYDFDPEPLGRGSYGEVLGATHRRTQARRAIKVVGKAGLERYVNDVHGFVRREVDILRRLDHPNIVRLYEAYEDNDNIYIVLEVCEGGDLLERVTVACDRMPEQIAANLMLQMLSAVQHMSLRGIVHRDLKPENYLFTRREPRREPLPPLESPLKLIDFGLSRRMGFEAGARMTPKIGTTEYMAPEAFAGMVDPIYADRTDVWSLGVVLHVIFIGHFPSPMISEVTMEEYISLPCWAHISKEGRDLMGKLLHKDPKIRPTVTVALRHPWLASAVGLSSKAVEVGRCLPEVLRAHSQGADLRRLALAFAAREVDDCMCHHLRELFQALVVVCSGALTRIVLEQILPYLQDHLRVIAGELVRNFVVLDTDGSGAIDWTEFLAAAIGGSLLSAGKSVQTWLPPLQEDVCWRTFDVLSQGSGCISQKSLSELFQPLDFVRGGQCSDPAAVGEAVCCRTISSAELQKLVREVDVRGVGRSSFLSLLRGR